MNISYVWLATLAILVLILSFYKDLANIDRTNRREWKRRIAIGLALLVAGASAEIARRVIEARKEVSDAANEAEARKGDALVHTALSRSADMYATLKAAIPQLPPRLATSFMSKADDIRAREKALTNERAKAREAIDVVRVQEAAKLLIEDVRVLVLQIREAVKGGGLVSSNGIGSAPALHLNAGGEAPPSETPGTNASLDTSSVRATPSPQPPPSEPTRGRPTEMVSTTALSPALVTPEYRRAEASLSPGGAAPIRKPSVGASMCNSRLTPQEGTLGYRMRGSTHCEGLYERLVTPGSLRPVSLLRADQPVLAAHFSLSWPTFEATSPVRLQATAFQQGMLYRMDTIQVGNNFAWPTEVLRKLGLQKHELGVIATTDKTIKGMNESVYLPVDLVPSAKSTRGLYLLKVASVEDLSEIYLTVIGPIDVDTLSPTTPATVFGDRPLKSSYYSSAAPIHIPLDLKRHKPGVYQVRVAGRRMNREGSTTMSFYMRHEN